MRRQAVTIARLNGSCYSQLIASGSTTQLCTRCCSLQNAELTHAAVTAAGIRYHVPQTHRGWMTMDPVLSKQLQ